MEEDEEFGGWFLGVAYSPSPTPQVTSCRHLVQVLIVSRSRQQPPSPLAGDLKPEMGSQEYHRWRASAPTTRLPWVPESGVPKTAARWSHREQGRWHFTSEAEYAARGKTARAVSDHIGLIMETTLGEQRLDDHRCQHCRDNDTECWVYTGLAINMVKHATPVCTRCRFVAVKGGCSFSTRKQVSTVKASSSRQRLLAPTPQPSFAPGDAGSFV